jgi:hypothetical protein
MAGRWGLHGREGLFGSVSACRSAVDLSLETLKRGLKNLAGGWNKFWNSSTKSHLFLRDV